MIKKFLTGVIVAASAISLYADIELAKDGKTDYTIIYDFEKRDVLLDPAVFDLSATLGEITGVPIPIKSSAEGPKIYIGVVPPGDDAKIQPRERRIKSVGKDLYFYGDYRYGTAGAIYNFLREFCGCRWYTITGDKLIPKNPNLKFEKIDYRHVPSFKSLEHGSKGRIVANNREIRDWVRRNNSFLMPNYSFGAPDDGWTYIGPVTHTLAAYLPPIARKPRSFNADKTFFAGPHPIFANKRYFETNPEYFTLDATGTRIHNKQACFSNPEVRKLLLKNVEMVIKAEKYDPSQYAVMDFTQNDRSGGFCFCKDCVALNEKYSTPGGVYFDFLVEMGNYFAAKYPKLTFRFFAYKEDMTGIPPKNLKFPDNMSVIIAPLEQDFSKSFSHRYNVRFLNQMRAWGKICKEIWIWNYPVLYTFGLNIYSLFPGVYRNTENLKLAHEAGVRYIIAEQGGSLAHGCSFKELNSYLQCLMAEHVDVDINAAIKEFCDAVYGEAADDIIKYLKETNDACNKDPGYFRYFNDPRVMRNVLHSPANLIRWQRAFERMEQKVKNNPRARFNLRRARINLDAVTILCYPACAKYDPSFAAEMPLEACYKRYCKYVREDASVQFRTFTDKRASEKSMVASFISAVRMAYEFHRREQKYPENLTKLYGAENLFTLMPCQSRRAPYNWYRKSASGFEVCIPVPDEKAHIVFQDIKVADKDGLPWNTVTRIIPRETFLTAENLKQINNNKGYQYIWIGRGKVSVSGILQLATLPERDARFFLGELFDPANPDQEFDFYLSIRKPARGKGLMVDRLVMAKVKGQAKPE